MLALFLVGGNRTAQRHIIALRPAAGEHDLIGFGVDDRSDVFACAVEQLLCFPRKLVQAGGVSVIGGKRGNHRVYNFFAHHGGCGVVKINLHASILFILSSEKLFTNILTRVPARLLLNIIVREFADCRAYQYVVDPCLELEKQWPRRAGTCARAVVMLCTNAINDRG